MMTMTMMKRKWTGEADGKIGPERKGSGLFGTSGTDEHRPQGSGPPRGPLLFNWHPHLHFP